MAGRNRRAAARRAALPLAAGLALAGCAAGNLTDNGRRVALAGADFAVPMRDMMSQRFATVIRQHYDFSCGSAALATLLTVHYDTPQSEEQVFLGMWKDGDQAQIRRAGFSLLDMKRFLAAHKVTADGYRVTVGQIAETGIPGIALITTDGYRHFVVVKGVRDGQVLIGDPALGLRNITVRRFERMWNGIYFVINDRPDLGRSAFGRAEEWALVPRTRFIDAMEPVSQQALALTMPRLNAM